MIGEARPGPGGGAMSVEEIERELARLRMNEDGTVSLRASVLNLIVVTEEDSAADVTRSVSELAGRYPSRVIVMICDPDEDEPHLDVGLSAFCNVRGGTGGSQVCAEQVTVHAEGPPAYHLESIAGPLLIPDLPTFLWYPDEFSPSSPEFICMADLADRVILNSAYSGSAEDALRELAGLIGEPGTPAVGDLQWVALTPWRTLLSELFSSPERTAALDEIYRVEVLYGRGGESRALLFVGWLASTLGWRFRGSARLGSGRKLHFLGPAGEIVVAMDPNAPDTKLRRVRLYSDELSFQVSRHKELREARSTVMRGDDLVAERTVHLGSFDLGVLIGEELRYRGRDEVYEAALLVAAEVG